MFHSDPSHSGVGTGNPVLTPNLIWKYNTGDNIADSINFSPVVANGVVYVGSYNKFYALNAATGEVIWTFGSRELGISCSPAVADGIVYFGSGDQGWYLYALDADNGHVLWTYCMASTVKSSPTIVNGVLYLGIDSCDEKPGFIIALNAKTGQQIWNSTVGGNCCPSVVNGVVYVGAGGYVYALDAKNGKQIWSYTAQNAETSSPPAVVNGVVYIPLDGSIVGSFGFYALNATAGDKLWNYMVGGLQNYIIGCPAVSEGVVYMDARDGDVYALNATDGTIIWHITAGTWLFSAPAVVDDVIYLGSDDGNLYALNATDGTVIWSYMINSTPGHWVYSSPAFDNGALYIGSSDHSIYAFGVYSGPTTLLTPQPATPQPTVSVTPMPTPTNTTLQAITVDGTNISLAFNGNITSSQITNATITTDTSANTTSLSFHLTGEKGTIGFCNITLPKSAIPYDSTSIIYIDNQTAQNQGYTQDNDNYYVWFTTHFSTHQVSIVFSAESQNLEFPFWAILLFLVLALSATVFVAVLMRNGKTKT